MKSPSIQLSNAPIALFVYNRPSHTHKTVNALKNNYLAKNTHLYVFCDGPKNRHDIEKVTEVRDIVSNIDGFSSITIHTNEANQGLANSIINGVTEVVVKHGRVIVFEDDLVSHPSSLLYFNQLLSFYQNNTGVFSISGFSYPERTMPLTPGYEYDVYAIPRMQCWGWATWEDRWSKADFSVQDFEKFNTSHEVTKSYCHWIGYDSLATLRACMAGEKDVWACRWVYTHFKYNAVCICPVKSLIDNIGLDGSGINCKTDNRLRNDINTARPEPLKLPNEVFIDPIIFNNFMDVADPYRKQTLQNNTDSELNLRNRNMTIQDRIDSIIRRINIKGQIHQYIYNLKALIFSCIEYMLININSYMHGAYTRKPTQPLVRIGTDYGGWWVPTTGLSEVDTVVSAGAGEDISFDVALANMFGCKVYILDPTPRAKKHFFETKCSIQAGQEAPINHDPTDCYEATLETFKNLIYIDIGLWSENTSIRFFAPEEDKHVSHSIGNLHNTDTGFTAEVITIRELINRESIDRISILKLDIEGAEYSVLDDLLNSNIKPWYILVEFHPGKSRIEKSIKFKTFYYIHKLRMSGYYLVKYNNWDYVFEFQIPKNYTHH